jgi:hypothetical protein
VVFGCAGRIDLDTLVEHPLGRCLGCGFRVPLDVVERRFQQRPRGSATGTRRSRASRRCGATTQPSSVSTDWPPPAWIALRPQHGNVVRLLGNVRVILLERLAALPAPLAGFRLTIQFRTSRPDCVRREQSDRELLESAARIQLGREAIARVRKRFAGVPMEEIEQEAVKAVREVRRESAAERRVAG